MQKKTTFSVDAGALVHAVFVAAGRVGTTKRGTYDAQDPTSYTSVTCWVRYEAGDPYVMRDWEHRPTEEELREAPAEYWRHQPPPESCYELEVHDVTWGVEVTLSFVDAETDSVDQFRGGKVLNFYLNHDSGEVLWEDGERVKVFLLDVLTGEAELLGEPVKFRKNMTEEELTDLDARVKLEAIDARMRRWAE